jgi:hypothetical protein
MKKIELRVIQGGAENRSLLALLSPAFRGELLAAKVTLSSHGPESLYRPRTRLRAV